MKNLVVILLSILLLLVGCSSNETVESELILPEGIPEFVKESDFEEINWDKKAAQLDNNIIGNENKSGVIGVDTPSLRGQKWMWHLWGIENPESTKLTIVGLHRETGTVHKILTTGWTIDLAEKNNGADAHAPSNVKIPNKGDWAILLYTNGILFDKLIYEINE